MRKLGFTFLFLFFLQSAYATGDSLNYLTHKDTVFIFHGNYGEKIFEHVLEPSQTLYSLARFYGLRIEDVYFYNPHLRKSYKPGQKVRISIPNKAIRRYKSLEDDPRDFIPVYYVVQKGDTFYGIANRYFKMPLDTIFARNNLNWESSLKKGQALHVGWMSIYGIPDSLRQFGGNPLWKKSFQAKQSFIKQSYRQKSSIETGAAYWEREKKAGNNLYALHRTAKIGSVISISNPMYNRTVYVKVIGRIPERAHKSDVRVILSPTVAKMLGAKDPKFFVELKYYR